MVGTATALFRHSPLPRDFMYLLILSLQQHKQHGTYTNTAGNNYRPYRHSTLLYNFKICILRIVPLVCFSTIAILPRDQRRRTTTFLSRFPLILSPHASPILNQRIVRLANWTSPAIEEFHLTFDIPLARVTGKYGGCGNDAPGRCGRFDFTASVAKFVSRQLLHFRVCVNSYGEAG